MERLEQIGGLTLRQDTAFPMLGTDSLLLSRFCTIKPGWRVLDLGCGVGVLAVLLAARERTLLCDGIELLPGAAALARRNLEENCLPGEVLCGDLREAGWFSEGHYDLIVSNPPYFPVGSGFPASRRCAEARSERTCTLDDLCAAAAPRLKTGGRFAVVCRSERLADLIVALRAHDLEPKRLQLVETASGKPLRLMLMEAVRQGGPGLTVEPVLRNF